MFLVVQPVLGLLLQVVVDVGSISCTDGGKGQVRKRPRCHLKEKVHLGPTTKVFSECAVCDSG